MKPSKTLVASLRKKELLPAGDLEIDSYYDLEAKMLSHIASLRETPSNIVWFDGECIENEGDYFALLGEFNGAANCESEIEIVRCEVDFEKGIANCSASRQGSLIQASWAQDSDWVKAEFLDFTASLLNSDMGEFVDIATGDQTYFSLFLPSGLLKRFNQYKERDTKSRDAFFMRHGEAVKQRYGNIKILPINDYRNVLRDFQNSFIDDGPFSLLSPYKKDSAIEVVYCSKWDDALDGYRLIKRQSLDTDLYADTNQWAFESVCPDEDCYFLSLNPAYDQVIFSERAKFLPTIVGQFPTTETLGEYLVVGTSGAWGVHVKEHSVICIGDPSTSLAISVSESVQGNENAKYFDRFIDDHYRPTLEELGYNWGVEKFSDFYSKTNSELRAAFSVNARQKHSADPLEVVVNIGVFLPSIASVLGEDETYPRTLLHYVMKYPKDSPWNRWSIKNEDTYKRCTAEMRTFIEENASWANGMQVGRELLKLYEDDEKFMHAAAVAVQTSEEHHAMRLARRALEDARQVGSRAVEKVIKMAESLGIQIGTELE